MVEDTDICLRNTEAHVCAMETVRPPGGSAPATACVYVFNVSDALCRGIKALADRDGVGVHAHAAENPG